MVLTLDLVAADLRVEVARHQSSSQGRSGNFRAPLCWVGTESDEYGNVEFRNSSLANVN